MSSTTIIDNFKDFDSELNIIDIIENWEKTKTLINIEQSFPIKATITKNGKELFIEIDDIDIMHSESLKKNNNISAQIGNFKLYVDSLFVKSTETQISDSEVKITNTVSVNIFKSANFNNQQSKYKCFIPIDSSNIPSFQNQFETITCQNEITNKSYKILRIDIEDTSFDIIRLKNGGIVYYIIEGLNNLEFQSFCDYCFSIRQALGFITKIMPGGEEFYFSDNSNFYYTNINRPQIDSMYQPLNTNPNAIFPNKVEIAERYAKILTRMTLKDLSKFVSLIHDSDEFSAAIILLLEASSIRSFLIIPTVFSVVVESLSKIISQNSQEKEYPIDDTKIADDLKLKLIQVVDSYSNQIKSKGILKIIRRISEINKPIIKDHLSNNEKLTLPFEQLNIQLSLDDINAIEHRNAFLHGDIILMKRELMTDAEINNYLGYISGMLYTLISALILKYVGYKGYIINHSKPFESLCNIKTDEDYYRLI